MASSLSILLLLCALVATTQAALKVYNLSARNLPHGLIGSPDAYVQVSCGFTKLGKTATRNNDRNPWWVEDFHHYRSQRREVLKLQVYDNNKLAFDDLMGTCQNSIQVGSWNMECYLQKGGTLTFSYTFTG